MPKPDVYHTNEGHAGFQGLERMSEFITQDGLRFDEALAQVRASTVFTTHTPVPAGIDRFPRDLIADFLASGLFAGLDPTRALALGLENYDGGDQGVFNMAVLGLHLGQHANGVSVLHGEVSRGMFGALWPGRRHRRGADHVDHERRARADVGASGAQGRSASGPSATRTAPRHDWTDRERCQRRRAVGRPLADEERDGRRGAAAGRGIRSLERERRRARPGSTSMLDPEVLTIGFARRVPTYKRLTLMLRDPERLTKLLTDPERPVQIVIGGKSHPADDSGKILIQQLVRFSRDPKVRGRIVFLPDYDITLAKTLYPGCDVWLNNPLRPLEACGTIAA